MIDGYGPPPRTDHTGARASTVRVLQTASMMNLLRCMSACALIVAACGGDTESRADAGDGGATASPVDTAVPAAATLLIEGQPHDVPVERFSTGADFALPFRTLVPDHERLAARAEPIAGAGSFAAEARFDWQPAAGHAFLRLVVLDSATSDNTARGLVRALGTDFGLIGSRGMEYEEAVPPPGHDWATLGYRLRGVAGDDPVTGWVSLGEHAGRSFYLMALYPPEYADGLAPRFDYILEHWVWLDTGEPL